MRSLLRRLLRHAPATVLLGLALVTTGGGFPT